MGTNGNKNGSERERQDGNGYPVYYKYDSSGFDNLFTTNIKMGTFSIAKVIWICASILGYPALLYGTYLTIAEYFNLGDISMVKLEEPFSTLYAIFGLTFGVIKLIQAIESLRKGVESRRTLRLQNDQLEWENKQRRLNYNHNKK